MERQNLGRGSGDSASRRPCLARAILATTRLSRRDNSSAQKKPGDTFTAIVAEPVFDAGQPPDVHLAWTDA
jgi:hypothetical protein